MKARVAVLRGGRSAEREISLLSAEGVLESLRALGYETAALDYDEHLVDELQRFRPAAVFNALHGGAGEDGTVQGLLDWLGIPYQGSGVRACAVAMDKWITKAVLQAQGLPHARGIRLAARDAVSFPVARDFGLPCVVKPNAEGSAVGVSIVRSEREWREAVSGASMGVHDIVIEEYIQGREFTVAILEEHLLPVVEITPRDAFYSYHAKYTPGQSTHTVPAPLEDTVAKAMQHEALALHRALGCRDYSRIDVMMDDTGRRAILECNTLPGLTSTSLFPDAARAAGISYDALVERLLLCALSRSSRELSGL